MSEKHYERELRILREKADALIEHINAQGGIGLRPVHSVLLEAAESFVNQAVERATLAMNSIRGAAQGPTPQGQDQVKKYRYILDGRDCYTDERSISGAEIKHRENVDSTYGLLIYPKDPNQYGVIMAYTWLSDLQSIDLTQDIHRLGSVPPATY